jgi:hypothetical protein
MLTKSFLNSKKKLIIFTTKEQKKNWLKFSKIHTLTKHFNQDEKKEMIITNKLRKIYEEKCDYVIMVYEKDNEKMRKDAEIIKAAFDHLIISLPSTKQFNNN